MRNTKSKIMIMMCAVLCIMAVGYAAFSTVLTITGTANIASEWKVVFTNITQVSKTSGVNIKSTPVASGTTATFNVGLTSPGDKIVYKITLANQGTIDAVIKNIGASATDSPAIIFTVEGVNIGDELDSKTSKDFTVTIEYDPHVTSQPDKLQKTLTVSIVTEQKINQSIDSSTPNVTQPLYLRSEILKNNVAYADTNIDFSQTSEATGTNGLYVTSTNTEGNLPTYYFRGAVENNYVKFGSYAIPPSCKYNDQDVYDDTLSEYATAENCTSTDVCSILDMYAVGMDEETCNQTVQYLFSEEFGFSTTETVCQYNGRIVMGVEFSEEGEQYLELTESQCTTGYVCDLGDIVFAGIDEETCLATEGTYAYANFEYKAFNAYTGEKADLIDSSDLWRIVRINEDGSIRLVTQDIVGYSAFNENRDDNAYVGYMYGATGQSGNNAYNLTHSNDNPSTIKTYLDTWYTENLSSYSSYLADAGFCNDRSVATNAGSWHSLDTALGYAKNYTVYGAAGRLANIKDWTAKENAQPQFKCPNEERDLFTTSTSNKGNKALTYPIGLLTADEVAYAGGVYGAINKSMYLSGGFTWTMSPFDFDGSGADAWFVNSAGLANNGNVGVETGVRPVANLQSGVEIISGDGTYGNPYTIK